MEYSPYHNARLAIPGAHKPLLFGFWGAIAAPKISLPEIAAFTCHFDSLR